MEDIRKDLIKTYQEVFNKYQGPKEEALESILSDAIVSLWIAYMQKSEHKDRAEASALELCKRDIIYTFRQLDLGDAQKSEEWYDKAFDAEVQKILEFCGQQHAGRNQIIQANGISADGRGKDSNIILLDEFSKL